MTPTIKFRKLHPNAIIPAYQTVGAAGMDLVWCPNGPDGPYGWESLLQPGHADIYETGLAVEIPEGYEGQLRLRSSTAKRGVIIPNAPGTVDFDYRGELKFILSNIGTEPVLIKPLERLVQLVIAPVARCVIQVAEELTPTERGVGGFGSTGR